MNVIGRITWLITTAVVVFFFVRYVFPLTGAVVRFFIDFLSHISRAAFGT